MGNYCEECGKYNSPLGPFSHECVPRTEAKEIKELRGKHIELYALLVASQDREKVMREAVAYCEVVLRTMVKGAEFRAMRVRVDAALKVAKQAEEGE